MTIRPIRKAVFPVGGLGTRFLPATKSMPKEMLPVVDKPLIQYAVEEARAAGIEEFLFVTGRGKTAIEDHFDQSEGLENLLMERGKMDIVEEMRATIPSAGQICYTRQQEPKGLGHAVWCARHMIGDEPFAILLADDLIQSNTPCLKQMIEAYNKVGGNMVAVMDVERPHTKRYGILDPGAVDGSMVEVKGLVEKPDPEKAPSTLAIVGRYIVQPQVLDLLSSTKEGSGGEIQLTDALASMIPSGPFHGYRFEGTRFDCGDKVGFIGANISFALDRPDLGAGVADYIKKLALDG
ncbi:MAG TPA: UTP--glucose-1-phosphate uridylyltransferase GalU [Alphaproteobacteria bacterium]|nr:UTP--glucose-1-phosphate uridylyltransferase GalU [Alphaproteobacteria bacterium]